MRLLVAALVASIAVLASASVARAGLPPPPPSASPCTPCQAGPPPPPALIPTAPPDILPPPQVVITLAVKVEPAPLHRGREAKLTVTADPGDDVKVWVRYQHEKPFTLSGTVDDSGTLTKWWKVRDDAALGKGLAEAVIKTWSGSYEVDVPFDVDQ